MRLGACRAWEGCIAEVRHSPNFPEDSRVSRDDVAEDFEVVSMIPRNQRGAVQAPFMSGGFKETIRHYRIAASDESHDALADRPKSVRIDAVAIQQIITPG